MILEGSCLQLPLEFGDLAVARRVKTKQPRGFSPGTAHGNRIALKGRPITRRYFQKAT